MTSSTETQHMWSWRELETRRQAHKPSQTAKMSFQCLHSCQVPSSSWGKIFHRTQKPKAFFDFMITLSPFRATCVQVFSAQQSSWFLFKRCQSYKSSTKVIFFWKEKLRAYGSWWHKDEGNWIWSCVWNRSGHNRRHVVYVAWELVSTVSKTRAWVEKNQMWPLADGSRGAPRSLDGTCYMTSVPDGLLINTHPLKTYRKSCAESPEISIPL